MKLEAYYREGLEELARKSLKDIQTETAYKWAGRALAAAAMGKGHDAIEYAHEAIEHAALCGKDGVLREVRDVMKAHGLEV